MAKIAYIGTGTQKVNLVAGSISVSATVAASVQYVVATTGLSTGTGMLMLGLQTDTARAVKVDTDGTLFVTGGGGGVQYINAATTIGATGTGTLMMGVQSTTSRALALSVTGDPGVRQVGVWTVTAVPSNTGTLSNVLTVGTVLGTLAISGTVDGTFGGGKQYTVDTTALGATGTGTLILGIQSTTARGMRVGSDGTVFVSHTGTADVSVVNTPTVIVSSITTGTVSVLGTITISGSSTVLNPPQQYIQDSTTIGVTGTGFLVVGVQSTTARALSLSVTGDPGARQIGTWNISTVSTLLGTVAVTAANVTIASVTTGTMNVVNVLSASGVTVASITTGTVNASLMATTAVAGAFVITAHASNWSSCVVSTTSGGGHAILKTSGAHTLYVTDLFVSVNVPMMVQFFSSSAAQAPKLVAYLATKGGFSFPIKTPIVLTSAQSLVFIGDASGSCSAVACGFTVT